MSLSESFRVVYGILQMMANSTDGISTGEIVETFGISRRSVPKYISILEEMGVPIYVDRKRYYLDQDYFVSFTLTPDESDFLYLALERALTHQSARWWVIRSLLRKLGGNTMTTTLLGKFDLDSGEHPSARWFTLLAQAKRNQTEVWVEYHPLNQPSTTQWRIRPYRFISNPLSDGFYVLCEGTRDEKQYIPLSLKFDRILEIRPTDLKYSIGDQARIVSQTGQAWGVWNTDHPPTHVQLRFEPRHYDRLLESIWHETQQLSVDNNGYVYFSVDVSAPEEMIPWIRSWGSGVVVIEPESLKQRIIRSLQRQLHAYGLTQGASQEHQSLLYSLWAKYDRKSGAYHLLIYHLLDVAAVAWMMWHHVLSDYQRQWLADLLHLDEESACRQIALLAALHDIGKATPSFQKKAQPLYQLFIDAGINERAIDKPHGILSTVILESWLMNKGMKRHVAISLASVIGGHHGSWIADTEVDKANPGGSRWKDLQDQLCQIIQETLDVQVFQVSEDVQTINTFAAFLSGFVSVCDWIGSDEAYFPYETEIIEPSGYFQRSLKRAEIALAEQGWFGWETDGCIVPFESIFPFPPNALQNAAITHCQFTDRPPRLILVEYLTGGGKTEVALYLADLLMNLFRLTGVYVAMPTQATSNQMFERVAKYLQTRYPHQTINLQLIHGQAEQHPLYQQLQPQPDREGNESGLTAQQWFQGHKRALLAPYAVGTVDQAMLSVLQVKHHFVRQYGLSHKVVIFDEIHGYDTYMNAIIDCLLEWLVALKSPMILLSATLSRTTRQNLLAQVGADSEHLPEVSYPRLTFVSHDGGVQVHPLPKSDVRIIQIQHIPGDPDTLGNRLASIYQQGGCIAVICNTVNEAICVARLLQNHPDIQQDDVLLFHARFPPAWRNQIEQDVLAAFGKNGDRPMRAILVATQIIEQSLDLDFDFMVTSVAPIDLIIQRAGRLHRHAGRVRPHHLQQPILAICTPMMSEHDVPDFGVDKLIYSEFILLKTWLVLRQITELRIPDDLDPIMDFVYNDDAAHIEDVASAYLQALDCAFQDMQMAETRSNFKGSQVIIGSPSKRGIIGNYSSRFSDDERNLVVSRDIRPSIDSICFTSDLPRELLDRKPTKEEVSTLLRYRVPIQHQKVKEALEQLPENPNWARIPQLRYARAIVFDRDQYHVPNTPFILQLTKFYGLEILEEKS
ncbi:MAG: hypothetical protein CUN56_03335 [Phototrophicales bacterium]|nr:MAG: hypothetical protein CUN56_03335 [Phototrophicales bacterium]RMG70778.1 MAG: CRISPR-associated helicase Cas3' [Chloroflexota bacterium]